MSFLRGYFNNFFTEITGFFRKTALASLLKIWLEDLQESGVDLEEYGRKETELHQQQLTVWNFDHFEYDADFSPTGREGTWVVKNLIYGPSTSDWKLEMDYWGKDAAENLKKMPGDWIEEDDSGGDESQVEGDYDPDEVGSEVDEGQEEEEEEDDDDDDDDDDDASDEVGSEIEEEGDVSPTQ